jgi:X-X-X-Leu-X-X-Gly heptad repeat protein
MAAMAENLEERRDREARKLLAAAFECDPEEVPDRLSKFVADLAVTLASGMAQMADAVTQLSERLLEHRPPRGPEPLQQSR